MRIIILTTFLSLLSAHVFAQPINFHSVDPGKIYRGARPTDKDLEYLSGRGIKTILNLQGGDLKTFKSKFIAKFAEPGELPENIQHERVITLSYKMQFINVPLTALFDVKEDQERKLQDLMKIMTDPKNHPIYVHCEHGKDRTGLVVALYRYYIDRIPPELAYVEMLQIGHNQNAYLRATHGMDEYFFEATGWNPPISYIFPNAW